MEYRHFLLFGIAWGASSLVACTSSDDSGSSSMNGGNSTANDNGGAGGASTAGSGNSNQEHAEAGASSGGSPAGPSGGDGSTEPGGAGGAMASGGSAGSDAMAGAASGGSGGSSGDLPAGFLFGPYKDTSINMNWNTNVASTLLPGAMTPLATDLADREAPAVTLSFATGECGSENWGGIQGDAMAMANVPLFDDAGIDYILATGGAAGSFTCGSDEGMMAFLQRWASPHLVGLDFDIEAGQTTEVIHALMERIPAAHAAYPNLRFSLTIATLANNEGGTIAESLGPDLADSLNVYGINTLEAAQDVIGDWPSYLTVNLMTMDYGSAGSGVCVVNDGVCDMGQSAIQAAYNLHDQWGVPFANIELTPMIGGNDVTSEQFTLADVDTISQFAMAQGLAGIHYWSYDRDTDCVQDYASPTCNSVGGLGDYAYFDRFASALP